METNADHPSDLALVRAVLREEARAIDELVLRMRCIPRILTLLNRRMGGALGPEDLGDLTQDVLARLWPRMERYTGEAALETWFYGFCFNGYMNAVRKKGRELGAGSLPESVAGRADEPPALEYDALHRGLERLEERDARVIRLKYYDGLTFDEIGGRLGLSPNSAKTCFYRGMRRLEELLRDKNEEGPA